MNDDVANGAVNSFLDGGRALNTTTLILTGVGVVLGLIGLAFVWSQLRKVKMAAEAAEQASSSTADQIGKITALVEVTELQTLAGEVVTHLRVKDYARAALRAYDLRGGVIQTRGSPHGAGLLSTEEWQNIVTEVVSVHGELEKKCHGRAVGPTMHDRCMQAMLSILDRLNNLTTTAVKQTGGR